MNRSIAFGFAALSAGLMLLPGAASAQQWKIFEEEGVSLEYRTADDSESLLSIFCSAEDSDVVVPVATGVKPPSQAPALQVQEGANKRTITLIIEVCGGEVSCTDRPDGEVSTYYARDTTKQLALRMADQATALSIDTPGAKITAPANRQTFQQFGKLCREQK